MRFYTTPHRFYAGIDLHTRTMHVCVLDHAGSIRFDRAAGAAGKDSEVRKTRMAAPVSFSR
jgi:hypothetical protein